MHTLTHLAAALTLGCGLATFAQTAPQTSSPTLEWDATFTDRRGSQPLHFVAHYTDAHGSHRLEEWRSGTTHLRRLTDDRIDLHADADNIPELGKPIEYTWQIVDLKQKVDSRISSTGMLHAGLFYTFYSMAHVVSRPAGRFGLLAVHEEQVQTNGQSCTWYQIAADAQPAQRVCWSSTLGIPLVTRTQQTNGSWAAAFTIDRLDRSPVPASLYRVDTRDLRIRNLDEIADVD
jgi:hypothetical protein